MNAIRVRLIDVESDTASEVAEVIARSLDGTPRASVERVQHAVLDTLEQVAKPDDQVLPAVEVIRPASPAAPAVTHAPDAPYAQWFDIPEQLRAWNAIGSVCHVAVDATDLTRTLCGHDLGTLRDPSRPILNDARPCAGCNRAIERLNRTDTT